MIPEEAVQAAHSAICEDNLDDCLEWRGRCVKAVEAAAPHLTLKLKAEVAYQKSRAAYFKYVPEIEHDPEGVQQLVIEMRAARDRYLNIPPFSSP